MGKLLSLFLHLFIIKSTILLESIPICSAFPLVRMEELSLLWSDRPISLLVHCSHSRLTLRDFVPAISYSHHHDLFSVPTLTTSLISLWSFPSYKHLLAPQSNAASRCYPISLLSFIAYFRSERLLSKQILNASISLPLSPQCGRPGLKPQVGKIPWRRKRQPAPVFLPGKSHGQRSLAGYSPWGYKESDTTERLPHTIRLLSLCYHCTETALDKVIQSNGHSWNSPHLASE